MSPPRFLAMALLVTASSSSLMAQSAPSRERGGPGQGMSRRGNALDKIMDALDVSPEQRKELLHKIEIVQQLQRDLALGQMGMMQGPGRPGGGGGPGGRGGPPPSFGQQDRGPGGPPSDAPNFGGGPAGGHRSIVQERFDDLQELLDDKNAKPEEIKAKIEALHTARAQVRSELAKAREELTAKLKPVQEAVLITAGILE